MTKKLKTLMGALPLLVVACQPAGPDVRPLERALGTAAPIAYAGTLALAAWNGQLGPCVELVEHQCINPPCGGEVTVTLGPQCPLPIGEDTPEGFITITSTTGGTEMGSYAAVFVGVDVGGSGLVVVNANTLTVTRTGDNYRVSYTDQDVEVASAWNTSVSQSAWTIDVDTRGTPSDPSDDELIIDGAAQVVVGTNVTQLSISNARLDPACRRNPVSGEATLQIIGGGIEVTTLEFHDRCDGRADIGTSISIGLGGGGGETVALDLLD